MEKKVPLGCGIEYLWLRTMEMCGDVHPSGEKQYSSCFEYATCAGGKPATVITNGHRIFIRI